MSLMFFAKLNVNSNIYDLYNETDKFYKLLDEIFHKLDNKHVIRDTYGDEYKFNSLIKNENDMVITGRLSKIYRGQVEKYDRANDVPIPQPTEDLSSSNSFCFDVRKEIIAYTISLNFGYKKFIEMFKMLLELHIPEVEFELILLNNVGDLKTKIESMKSINEVTITLIPPNRPNIDEFREIFGTDRADEILESGGTKYTEKIEISTKKGKSIILGKFFQKAYKAIKRGYGKIVTKGTNESSHDITISSEEDAPLKKTIDTEQKHNLIYIEERARQLIKNTLVEINMNEPSGAQRHINNEE